MGNVYSWGMETKNLIKEVELAKEIGVSRRKLQDEREVATAEVHWTFQEGRGARPAIVWTPEGVEWLKSRLGDWEAPETGVKEDETCKLAGRVTMLPNNRKLIVCEIRGRSEKVLTRDQKLFRLGMFVPIKELTRGVFAVERYPRPNGKY